MDFTDCVYAFHELKKAVESGQISAQVEKVFRRLVFSDKMIPCIGNKYAFEEFLNKQKLGFYCVVDINSFKQVNDLFGHSVGDEVIVKVGKAIRAASVECYRLTGRRFKVFRIGGDEFVVFWDSAEEIRLFFRILHTHISSLEYGLEQYKLSISLGCGFSYEVADSFLLKAKEIKTTFLNDESKCVWGWKLPNIFVGEVQGFGKGIDEVKFVLEV
jgi:diguanylate cyclase (GGDEF)-like protein